MRILGSVFRVEHYQLFNRQGPSRPFWLDYIHRYIAHQAWREVYPHSLLSHIRLTAEEICRRDSGDVGKDAVMKYLVPLCELAARYARTGYAKTLPAMFAPNVHWKVSSEADRRTDLLVAAMYLKQKPLVKQLVSGVCVGEDKEQKQRSDVFGPALGAAIATHDLDMIGFAVDVWPSLKGETPTDEMCWRYFVREAWNGALSRELFNFVLEAYPSKLSRTDIPRFSHLRINLQRAATAARWPEEFKRGQEMLSCLGMQTLKQRLNIFKDTPNEELALHAFLGSYDMVRYLLDLGVRTPDDCYSEPSTRLRGPLSNPLNMAIQGRHERIVEILLQHGLKPCWWFSSCAPVLAAAEIGSVPIAKMLVQYGADVNEGLYPPIVSAVRHEDVDMFRFLRANGAILNTPETGGRAMAVAMALGLDSMIDLLVEEGVERNVPLHYVRPKEEKNLERYSSPEFEYDLREKWSRGTLVDKRETGAA